MRAADGTNYDTRVPLRDELGRFVSARPIGPGTTRRVALIGKYLRVRWRGPRRVRPAAERPRYRP